MKLLIMGLFDRLTDARNAVHDLIERGVPREDISLVARGHQAADTPGDASGSVDTAVHEAEKGAMIGGLAGLMLGLTPLAAPGVGPIAVAGWLLTTLAGAGVGAAAGGVVGALVGLGVPDEEAGFYAEGLRRGGTLVTVMTDGSRTSEVSAILDRHHAIDIQERSALWQQEGWTGFDSNRAHDTESASKP